MSADVILQAGQVTEGSHKQSVYNQQVTHSVAYPVA